MSDKRERAKDEWIQVLHERVLLADRSHGPIKSRHELYGLLHEEAFEVFDAIREDRVDDRIASELIDTMVVCVRGLKSLRKA